VARPSEKPHIASCVDASASFRDQLAAGEEVIDLATFAGSIPAVNGVAPRIRIGRDRWFNLLSIRRFVAVTHGLYIAPHGRAQLHLGPPRVRARGK
jgi:hypothetical protein